jgi:hypothetical protein
MFSCLLAQILPPDPISGGAGWLGAGLLGLVLGWLLFVHLPAKDKQLREIITDKDKQGTDKDDKFTAALREISGVFRDEMVAERKACEERFNSLVMKRS